jgi:hypothetical protein
MKQIVNFKLPALALLFALALAGGPVAAEHGADDQTAVLDKAVKYQQTNNLTIDSTLVANAQAAKATSAGSISALQTAKPAIDCTNPSVADEVATFKTAAQTTRSNLKAYRDSVKAVLKALEAAKAPAEGSNQ